MDLVPSVLSNHADGSSLSQSRGRRFDGHPQTSSRPTQVGQGFMRISAFLDRSVGVLRSKPEPVSGCARSGQADRKPPPKGKHIERVRTGGAPVFSSSSPKSLAGRQAETSPQRGEYRGGEITPEGLTSLRKAFPLVRAHCDRYAFLSREVWVRLWVENNRDGAHWKRGGGGAGTPLMTASAAHRM